MGSCLPARPPLACCLPPAACLPCSSKLTQLNISKLKHVTFSPAAALTDTLTPSPALLFPDLQGGGFGEVHLRITYWPFELIDWHKGE